jgi:hypothetical protein
LRFVWRRPSSLNIGRTSTVTGNTEKAKSCSFTSKFGANLARRNGLVNAFVSRRIELASSRPPTSVRRRLIAAFRAANAS